MPDYVQEFERWHRDLMGALRQMRDFEFFNAPAHANSTAIVIQHLAGNFRSRFTDFLTTDGEKAWRDRYAEFEDSGRDRQEIMDEFESAWDLLHGTVSSLSAEDMQRTVTIRGKEMSVADALLRNVTHFASHVGQVILMAKHFRGDEWQTVSIPKQPAPTEE